MVGCFLKIIWFSFINAMAQNNTFVAKAN